LRRQSAKGTVAQRSNPWLARIAYLSFDVCSDCEHALYVQTVRMRQYE